MMLETEKQVNAYSPEELALNKRLYEECIKTNIDYVAVEYLLKQGADPLGFIDDSVWKDERIYSLIVSEADFEVEDDLPRLTDLFLKYGMDVDNPRVPYDVDDNENPLWNLGLSLGEYSIQTLKLFLDNGLSANSFGLFWSTAMGDLIDVSCGNPNTDGFWNEVCTLSLKATMLASSYDHVLNEYENLRKFIGYSYNHYDVHKFRNWNDFTYEFDTSRCKRYPELYQSVVTIYENSSKKAVWKFGVYLDESEFDTSL